MKFDIKFHIDAIDIISLRPGNWLYDTVIDAWSWATAYETKLMVDSDRRYFFPSGFAVTYFLAYHTGLLLNSMLVTFLTCISIIKFYTESCPGAGDAC